MSEQILEFLNLFQWVCIAYALNRITKLEKEIKQLRKTTLNGLEASNSMITKLLSAITKQGG